MFNFKNEFKKNNSHDKFGNMDVELRITNWRMSEMKVIISKCYRRLALNRSKHLI